MKKLLTALTAGLLAAFCISLTAGCGNMFSCGGTTKEAKQVSLSDYFNQNKLTVKTTVYNLYRGGSGVYFDFETGLSGFKGLIDAKTDTKITYETQIFGDVLLITMRSAKTSYFTVKLLKDSANRFILSDMTASVFNEVDPSVPYNPRDPQSQSPTTRFLFPYHFCQEPPDANSQDFAYQFNPEDKVPINAAYSDLKAFYQALERPEYVFDDAAGSVSDGSIILTVTETGLLIQKIS